MPRARLSRLSTERGISLLGLIVILLFVSLLLTSSHLMMRRLVKPLIASETTSAIDEARRGLFVHVKVWGSLPAADVNDDGVPDTVNTSGGYPFALMGVRPKDQWGRPLQYQVLLPGLNSVKPTIRERKRETCQALSAMPATYWAAKIISDGPTLDLDDDDLFQGILSGGMADKPPATPNTNTLYGWLLVNAMLGPNGYDWVNCPP